MTEFQDVYRDESLRSRMARYAYRRANGDHELAADACQEAWLAISRDEAGLTQEHYWRIGRRAVDAAIAQELQYQDGVEMVCRDVVQGDAVQLITFSEALVLLRCSRATLHRKIHAGEIPYVRHTGQRLHFLQADLESYLNAHRHVEVAST